MHRARVNYPKHALSTLNSLPSFFFGQERVRGVGEPKKSECSRFIERIRGNSGIYTVWWPCSSFFEWPQTRMYDSLKNTTRLPALATNTSLPSSSKGEWVGEPKKSGCSMFMNTNQTMTETTHMRTSWNN